MPLDDTSRRRFLSGGLAAALAGYARPMQQVTDGTVADTTVTSADELQDAFRTLSPGDTIRIGAENAPYRTTEWLDVDVDGVTVVGPGIANAIMPADGANVGGIRIGHNAHCEGVDVRWVGVHGNPDGQDPAVKRCHGFVVRDASDVTLRGNVVTRTHPYHEHNSGGSGISVEHESSNVRIEDNYVHDVGDRGIQVSGDGVVVSGNFVVDGYDRSISCDVPEDRTYRARSAIVSENVLGNNAEGSLVGVGGAPATDDFGFFAIANNVGFGPHKHFCHLGFDGRSRNVTIEGNVSVQDADNGLAGVSVDIERARGVTIRNNALYEYSGRGINVSADIEDFAITGNGIYEPGAIGVRVAGGRNGHVRNNYVDAAAENGIVLADARAITVAGNRIRDPAGSAIVSRNASEPSEHLIADNYVHGYGVGSDRSIPAIHVLDSGNLIRENWVHGDAGPAIAEGEGAGNNRFHGNLADGSAPWAIHSPTSLVRHNSPPIDVHRGLTADGSGVVAVNFEKPYERAPQVTFGRVAGGIDGRSFETDDRGHFVGLDVRVADRDAPLDVFVDAAE